MNKSESKYFNTAVKMDQALIALLNEKPFEYITVREICDRAGVNRSTFYLHYETTRDLLEETSRYLFQEFRSCFLTEPLNSSGEVDGGDLRQFNYITEEYIHPYLAYVRENQRVFSIVLSHAEEFDFEGVFQRLFRNIFDPILERFHYPTGDRKYVMRFYLNGLNAVVVEWLGGGCRESIEEMSRIIQECIFGLERV